MNRDVSTGNGVTLYQAREIGRKIGLAQAANLCYGLARRTKCREIALAANAVIEFAASGLTEVPEDKLVDAHYSRASVMDEDLAKTQRDKEREATQ